MRMCGGEKNIGLGNSQLIRRPGTEFPYERLMKRDEIGVNPKKALPRSVFEIKRFGIDWIENAIRWLSSGGEARKFDGAIRRDINLRNANFQSLSYFAAASSRGDSASALRLL